jgi:hypothetical protein
MPAIKFFTNLDFGHQSKLQMTKAEELYHQIGKEIPDVAEGKMFGALCLKTPNGKSGVMFWKESLVVKLQGDLLEEAKSLDGVKPFEPMEGRPMKEWMQVPYEHRSKWKKYAVAATAEVKKIKKK